jgi:4-hydroxy-3-methylbut-2-enyl diphosphate reductase
MKQFEIPSYYRSPIISKVKNKRKLEDPRKKDFTPSKLRIGTIDFYIPRHFGFCYGVENAIEIAYRAVHSNPTKKIYLLSQMIHNPGVNEDLQSYGITFIQDTKGNQLIPWENIKPEDIVIIPAFGTTIEIENKLKEIGVAIEGYNTTCPFVEKVWNRSSKLGEDNYTIVIHGKNDHEETRATFSHSSQNTPSIVVKDITEAKKISDYILGEITTSEIEAYFKDKCTKDFNFETDLTKIGVVNQTTMLAEETQEITDLLRETMLTKYGETSIKEHIADTRDTLCYATNDNQSATYGLLEENVDIAIVVGGYNSSNTTHLVELLEKKFKTYFIENENSILNENILYSFDIHTKEVKEVQNFFPEKTEGVRIAITSGASCPDSVVDNVIQKLVRLTGETVDFENLVI